MTTTRDGFLGGRLQVRQPAEGYRAGADPVFLAAAVPARSGQSVLELGCGAGVAMLCLMARVPGLNVTGLERDEGMADLARKNLTENGFSADVVAGDIADMPEAIRSRAFDHVIANPPFFDRARGSVAQNPTREAGRGEETELAVWVDNAIRRLVPTGVLTLIQRTERLPDCLAALDDRVGSVAVLPLAPRQGRPAKLVVLQAKKGGRGAFRMLAPIVLHDGERHLSDGESYSETARDVLRRGAAMPM